MELNNVIKENVDKKSIKVPEFVKRISDEEIAKIAKLLSDGKTEVYALRSDEKTNELVKTQVFVRNQIIMQLTDLEDVLEQKEELYKEVSGLDKKELKKELKELYKQKQEILAAPTYTSLISFEGNQSANYDMKTDLAVTLEEISTYCMKKTD